MNDARRSTAPVLGLLLVGLLLVTTAVPADAYKPYTHVSSGSDVRGDVIDDGAVTVTFDGPDGSIDRTYPVDPTVVAALREQPAAFSAGVVGPDGFPDLVFGQQVVHAGETGLWLDHVLRAAWEAQNNERYTLDEQQKALAFAYGYVLHAVGDVWSHTLVNEVSEGVFPPVGTLDGAEERAIALRHVIVEGHLEDATPGFDGDPREQTVGDGISTDSTRAIPFDPPIHWLYDTFVAPGTVLPVGVCGDGVDDDRDGVVDDGCPGGPFRVGDAEPVRGLGVDGFLDLQADLQVLAAQLALDIAQVDCLVNCEERTATQQVLTVRGVQTIEEAYRACDGVCLPDPADAADDATEALLRDYIVAWIDDIRSGLAAWPELGRATTRALFDPATFRAAQDDLCEVRGPDTFDNEARRSCEQGISTTDAVVWASEDFRDDHLISMLGAPDLAGDVLDALQAVSDVIDDIIGASANPLRLAGDELVALAKDKVNELVEERFGVDTRDLDAVLAEPTDSLVRNEIDLGDAGGPISLFDDEDRGRLDELAGLDPRADYEVRPLTDEEAAEGRTARWQLEPGSAFTPGDFGPYDNVGVLSKLALLDGEQLDAMLTDATGSPVTYYRDIPYANVMTVGAGTQVVTPEPDLVPGPVDAITVDAGQVNIGLSSGISSFGPVGDVNGDGEEDYAVGSTEAQRTSAIRSRGTVHVIHGPLPDLLPLDLLNTDGQPTGFVVAGATGDGLGSDVRAAGDVNGDGLDDVYAWAEDGLRAYVILGTTSTDGVGLERIATSTDEQTRAFAVSSSSGSFLLPRSAAPVGDVDGDGLDDVAVASRNFAGWNLTVVAGRAAPRSVDVADAVEAVGNGAPLDGVTVVFGSDELAVTGRADLRGDGTADLVVVEEGNPGKVHVLTGGTLPSDYYYLACDEIETPSVLCDRPTPGHTALEVPFAFGANVDDVFLRVGVAVEGIPDVTGDGRDDLALVTGSGTGDSNIGRGLLHVVPGGFDGTADTLAAVTNARVIGPEGPQGDLGMRTVRSVGDIDGDGTTDLAAVSTNVGGDANVTILYGGSTGLLNANTLVDGGEAWGRLVSGDAVRAPSPFDGVSVVGIEDRDDDGRAELALVSGPRSSTAAVGEVRYVSTSGRPLVAAPDSGGDGPDDGEVQVDLDPWLLSIDADHAWRADSRPRVAEPSGGSGGFPLWEDCVLRDAVWRPLFTDWEDPLGGFPDLGDAPSELLPGSSGCALDGDAIDADVDGPVVDGVRVDESRTRSSAFSDEHLGGSTSGAVTTGTGEVSDAPESERGVVLRGLGDATATVCDRPTFDVLLSESDVGVATCGSLSLQVLRGDITVRLLGGLLVEVPSSGDVLVTDETIGNQGSVELLLSDGRTVSPGATVPITPPTEDPSDGPGAGEDGGASDVGGGDVGLPAADGDADTELPVVGAHATALFAAAIALLGAGALALGPRRRRRAT